MARKDLVLGGCGFIGSHVCDALAEFGHEVVVYDVYQDPNCKFPIQKGLEVEGFDRVYNFAGVLGTSSSFNYIPHAIYANVDFAARVMNMCFKSNVELLNVALPPSMWLNPYAITKDCMRQFANMFYDQGLRGITIIPYNIYGERQIYTVTEKLIPSIIHHILNHKLIPVYSLGQQVIDLMYVKDLAKFVASIDDFDGSVIHAGTGKGITVLDVVHLICDMMKAEAHVYWLPRRKGEAEKVYVVADKPTSGISFTNLTDGLKNTIEWYQKFENFYKGTDTYNNRVSTMEPWEKGNC